MPKKKKPDIILTEGPGMPDEAMDGLDEAQFGQLADKLILEGDAESFLRLMERYEAFALRYAVDVKAIAEDGKT